MKKHAFPSLAGVLFAVLLNPAAVPAQSTMVHLAADPANMCRTAAAKTERQLRLPLQLLAAISLAETGRKHPEAEGDFAWPWTVNAAGQSIYYESKETAVVAVLGMMARGQRSIDVGCMQINLSYHPDAFSSIEAAFDPEENVRYAALFLMDLRDQNPTWGQAIANYHSSDPVRYVPYKKKVYRIWRQERRRVSKERRLSRRAALEPRKGP